jgi:hypothetical protein
VEDVGVKANLCPYGSNNERMRIADSPMICPMKRDETIIKEMYQALRLAEIALCNSVPVTPYPREGPLVFLRKTLWMAEKYLAIDPRSNESEAEWRRITGPSPASTTQQTKEK